MIGRTTGGTSYTLTYDAENHLISVSGSAVASFVYDGDGLRVKSPFGSGDRASIASFSGKHFEVNSVYRESFDDLAAQNWQVITGTWQLLDGGYRQSNTTYTNTFTYYNLLQNQPQVVQWKATYTSGTQAGLYFYASAAAASDAERGNSYRVWQDASYVYIYEAVNNSTGTYKMRFNAANAAGQTHSYQAMYNPQNGKIQVWRDGSYLGSWTDSTPLTTGNYLSLRTTTNNVLFDEVMVGKVKKYYYQGGVRTAMRDGTSVYYLFGDHLGSTNVTTDNGSALVARLLYKPFGQVRYNTNNQKTETLRFTQGFTGQWWASGGGATLGLYDYGARWYDPLIGRFLSADTIVPNNSTTVVSGLTVNFSNYDILEELNRENRNDHPCGLGIVQWFDEAGINIAKNGGNSSCTSSGSELNSFGPVDPQNLNRYTYVNNNSLRYVDPTGYWTISIGFGGAVFAAIGLRGGATIAFDGEGNIAVLAGGGGGGYAAVGFNSVGPNVMITNAPTVDKLEGFSVQFGGQVGEAASIGAEVVIFSSEKQTYFGLNVSGGAALQLPVPGELHASVEHDWKIAGPYKIRDLSQRLLKKLGE